MGMFCPLARRAGKIWQGLVSVNFLPKPAGPFWPLVLAIFVKYQASGLLNIIGIVKCFVNNERVQT